MFVDVAVVLLCELSDWQLPADAAYKVLNDFDGEAWVIYGDDEHSKVLVPLWNL
jgi:hypothetical protein